MFPQTPAGTACDAEPMVKESRVTAQFLQAYCVWVPPCTQVKGIFVSTPTALLAPAVSSGKGERDTSNLILFQPGATGLLFLGLSGYSMVCVESVGCTLCNTAASAYFEFSGKLKRLHELIKSSGNLTSTSMGRETRRQEIFS